MPATRYLTPPGTQEQAVSDAPETFPLDPTPAETVGTVAEVPAPVAVEEKPAQVEKPAAKKPKAPVKKPKAPVKKEAKKTKAPARKKPAGLRIPQKRALTVLIKHTVPPGSPPIKGGVEGMTIANIARKAGLSGKVTSRGVGTYNTKSRAAHDAKYGKSLLSLGLVRVVQTEEGPRLAISAAGRKYWDSLEDRKLPPKHPGPQSRKALKS